MYFLATLLDALVMALCVIAFGTLHTLVTTGSALPFFLALATLALGMLARLYVSYAISTEKG